MLSQISQTTPRAWFDHPTRRADDLVLPKRVGLEHRPALGTRLAQVVQPGQPSALALPVTDGVLDELERRVPAEIADRKDGLEDRLQTGILPLGRQPAHLEEPPVRLLLNFDQVRDRDRRLDFRKVNPLAIDVLREGVHS